MINIAFILERVEFDTETGCWNWIRSKTTRGYGDFRYKQKHYYAHRVSYQLAHGPIPEGMEVRHKCDNPNCCNPLHLELGTHAENMEDSYKRGRASTGEHHATKLTLEDVIKIRHDPRMHKDIAAEYGVSHSHISNIKNGKSWRHD